MTYKEQIEMLAKKIKEFEGKYYISVSPRMMQGNGGLIRDYESLALYEAREENTEKFVEKQATDLITKSYRNNGEAEDIITLGLVYEDGWDDFPDDDLPFEEFIMKYKDKFLAVYRYVKSTEERSYFIGFLHRETVNNYGEIYLDFGKLLELLKENDISCTLYTPEDTYISSHYRDDFAIKFTLSYGKKNNLDGEDSPSLKRK